MFTGIVEEIGTVVSVRRGTQALRLSIRAEATIEGTRVGDSIAVNGTCLTVTEIQASIFSFDVMGETLRHSTADALAKGAHVNLERAIAAGDRFGGHLVSGHIDGTATVACIEQDGIARSIKFSIDSGLRRFIITKGSIAIDGISLTVTDCDADSFSVSVIPHTCSRTILVSWKTGDAVNIECDMAAKYFEKNIAHENKQAVPSQKKNIDREFLRIHGFMED